MSMAEQMISNGASEEINEAVGANEIKDNIVLMPEKSSKSDWLKQVSSVVSELGEIEETQGITREAMAENQKRIDAIMAELEEVQLVQAKYNEDLTNLEERHLESRIKLQELSSKMD